MTSFNESMLEYRRLLSEGRLQRAYQGLMAYFSDLRTHLRDAHPGIPVSKSIYYGYMDMTYFALVPEALKELKLKIALVFLHEDYRFVAWLSGANRDVQAHYWHLLKESGWDAFRLSDDPRREDFVLEQVLVQEPEFGDLDSLTAQIEEGILAFIGRVEEALDEING